MSIRRPRVFGVDLDRFYDQVKFISAVDLSRNTVEIIFRNSAGFFEVIEMINSFGMMVLHDKNQTLTCFYQFYQREMVGAKIEHD